jgi:DNA-binding winged helix-turn-helix (wHTH) protein/Tfp pilus assembly protein PilF
MNEKAKHFYEFGPFRLNATERMLLRSGRLVPLKPKVFDLLLALVENADRILAKEELMNRIWADSFVEEGNLTVNISNLRRILGQGRNNQSYIETIPRRGYRFVAHVKERWDNGPVQALNISLAKDDSFNPPDLSLIAVLPFKSIGAKPADEYLGLGLADALITKLSNIKQITVRPTTAIRKYTEAQDPVAVGRKLNVMAVLDGSIQRAGKRIRVTVQLIDARNSATLWAEKYDEQFTNIFALEDSISARVTEALTLKLTGKEIKLLSKHYTENTEAYLAYLKGRYLIGRRAIEELEKAIKCFEQAIAADPHYARAYSGLADCYNILSSYILSQPDYYISRAKEFALKALELDDTLAEAHASLAHIKMKHEWDWPGAEKEFKRAIELNPNSVIAHQWYAVTLNVMGRPDEALREVKRAQEIDPLSLIVNTSVGFCYYLRRDYDKAIRQLSTTIELDPSFAIAHSHLGVAYEGKQRYEESIAEFHKAISLMGTAAEVLAYLGHAYAMSGRVREARAILGELEELSLQSRVPYYYFALIHTALGHKDEAFKYLTLSYDRHDEDMALIKVDPRMDRLRDDARFANLVERLGL